MFSNSILKATLEESADEKQEKLFVAAGFVGRQEFWATFERGWRTKLDDWGLKYYKTSEWKNLAGEFSGFQRSSANIARAELENIILSNRIIAFSLGIVMEDYNKVRSEVPASRFFYEDDPSVPAFYHLMDAMNRTVRKKAKECCIAFVYDDSTRSAKISHAFEALKTVHPIAARTLTTFTPQDDKEHPSLQATDLLAEIAKNTLGEWLARGRPRHVSIPKGWEQNWDFCTRIDERYMLNEMNRTLASQRFKKGLLPVRPVGKRQRRRERRSQV